ncbi:MAG: ribose 5-phosphate isomerase B [Candidatus Eisenbacteria bacterium]
MRPPSESDVRRLVTEAVERALGPDGAVAPAASAIKPALVSPRRIAIGCDHGGLELKEVLKRALIEEMGMEVHDCGTHSNDPVDYPDSAAAVGREVASGRAANGIVIDSAGIGSTMAANKVPGVRCALCHDDATVRNSREHNDANVLALGSKVVNRGAATRMVRLFLNTEFAGGRHERRVRKIMALERGGS